MEKRDFSRTEVQNDRFTIKKGMGLTHSIYSTWKGRENISYEKISEMEKAFRNETINTRKEIRTLASELTDKKILQENEFFIIGLEERISKKTWLSEEEKEKYRFLLSVIPDQEFENPETDFGKNNFPNTIKSIDDLDINPDFQKKVINFMYEAYKEGHILTIWESVRTIETQKEYYDKGWTKTMNSLHLTGEAIDFRENGSPYISLKAKQIAAKHGFLNGAEMWDGFDEPHFQLKYTGNKEKQRDRLLKMRERGTLPPDYIIPEEEKKED